MLKIMIGGKALYLDKLKRAGFNVPAFFVLNSPLNEKKVLDQLALELPKVQYFAVRSSAACEDSEGQSYAGYFYSAIGVEKQDVSKEFLKVKESYQDVSGDVIVQEFIPSEKSGVLFTDAGDGKIVINSNFGLCDLVVKGYACDEYIFDKSRTLISQNIPPDKQALFFENGMKKTVNINNKESLTPEEIQELLKHASKIEEHMGKPQDIEWCFYKNKLYILQSRPITKNIFNDEKIHYDSANIAESYSGIVLPLTFSFASFVYKTVYEDLLVASGVSRKKITKHKNIFDNMIKLFYGRIYYNMNNWYKTTAFIPGYKRNKQNFEHMITSNIKEELAQNISPSLWLKIKYPFLFVFKLATFQFKVRIFKKTVEKNLKEVRELSFQELNYEECRNLYNGLNNKLLRNWYISVENDFFVMTYLGILKKIFSGEELNNFLHFESVSTEQVKELQSLAQKIKEDTKLWNTLKKGDQNGFMQTLKQSAETQQKLSQYYLKYGGRFANELKLESSDIEEDFDKFREVVKAYSFSTKKKTRGPRGVFKGDNQNRLFPRVVLGRFKKYARERERLRLLRSNSFAIVRKICNRMGDIFVNAELIDNKKDIFYLTLDEVFKHPNLYSAPHFHDRINKRKIEYETYNEINLPSHFSLSVNEMPSVVLPMNTEFAQHLQGRPCTPGSIIGRVKVFKEFAIPEGNDFDIIVARHTDPGWTTLIGLSKGLIVEHGGVLSHASIVSRELGIPTVIGALGATEYLVDGQIVELNGSTGIVRLLSDSKYASKPLSR